MKTTLRVIAIALAALFVTACDSDKKYTEAPFRINRIDGTIPKNRFELLCDEAMDVTYIKMSWNNGGITVRVDSTGAPVRCSSVRTWRRR